MLEKIIGDSTEGTAGVPSLLTQFAYLQLLDLLTTLTSLASGVGEANPMIRFLVAGAGSALGGLLAAKFVALGLALHCWRGGRLRLLGRVNLFYAALVAWNVIVLLVKTLDSAPV
jgi:hypothetical protein